MFRRRPCLRLLALAPWIASQARAQATARVVYVPTNLVGAIVGAEGGSFVEVLIEDQLANNVIRLGDGPPVRIDTALLTKGSGKASLRFLDDPRNAPKLGGTVRDLLIQAIRDREAAIVANHRAWTHPFARTILAWQRKLERSKLRGQRVRDVHGRIYLLEWAGAIVDPNATNLALTSLSSVPNDAASPTLSDYRSYLDTLVAALS